MRSERQNFLFTLVICFILSLIFFVGIDLILFLIFDDSKIISQLVMVIWIVYIMFGTKIAIREWRKINIQK